MPQIRKILEKIPTKRQNLLFSATFPEKVDRLAEEFLEFPEKIEVTPQATPAETIWQTVYKTYNFQTKLNLLLFILKSLPEEDAALVFVKTKKHATEIGKFLKRKLPVDVAFLHANKGTNTRMAAVEAIQNGTVRILVTTDVASRGLDIARISLVINFDIPIQYEDYVHRIGRTGRALREGRAISFVNTPDEIHLARVEGLIRMKIHVETTPDFLIAPETPFEEQQEILKKLDNQRKKADPTFQGAFHEKKEVKTSRSAPIKKPVKKKPASSSGKKFKPGVRSQK